MHFVDFFNVNTNNSFLKASISSLRTVDEPRAQLLQTELGIFRVGDLLTKYPFRYIDKTTFHKISQIRNADVDIQIKGKIINTDLIKGKNNRYRFEALVADDTGHLKLTWFQGAKWMEKYILKGKTYIIFGKVSRYGSSYNIVHPEMELLEENTSNTVKKAFEPVYNSTEKLDKKKFDLKERRKVVREALSRLTPDDIKDFLPEYIIQQQKLCSFHQAIYWIHFPNNVQELRAAQRRIKFQELFLFQLQLLANKIANQRKLKGALFDKVGDYFLKFYNEVLPFELTGAQKRVIKEIRKDVSSGIQMNRLLQGDVGSGKTIVGFMSMLLAIDNGYQVCLMAPTAILANQHFKGIAELAEPLGIRVEFLSGSVKGKKRTQVLEDLKDGQIDILIGTHALIEDTVVFKELGMAVIDEQHRFGVAQRAKLWKKNKKVAPHILIMTATPIPRTLSMTVYGDLDVSIIDELPPGRKEVKTIHKYETSRMRVIEFMRKEIAKGRQIYVVYPLIEESDKLDLEDLNNGYLKLAEYFPHTDYKISVVHGKMKPQEKDAEMESFVKGQTDIMVATTVIEVGVNVPNASVMVIENSERFGLSQLHQLRGRVGRGAEQSFCILMSGYKLSNEAKKRIKTMCETNDGFRIAEVDLELRGAGDIQGTKQSGDVSFNLSNITEDGDLLRLGRRYAQLIMEKDANLDHELHQNLKKHLIANRGNSTIWGRIS